MNERRAVSNLDCPICFEPFATTDVNKRLPRNFPCEGAHTMCTECLVKLAQQANPHCPTCRQAPISDIKVRAFIPLAFTQCVSFCRCCTRTQPWFRCWINWRAFASTLRLQPHTRSLQISSSRAHPRQVLHHAPIVQQNLQRCIAANAKLTAALTALLWCTS